MPGETASSASRWACVNRTRFRLSKIDSINPGAYNHIPGGANSLYLDGHVQFNKFPGDFPATRVFAGLVGAFQS